MARETFHGSESEVICVGSEVNFKSSGAVIEGLDSKGPGSLHGTEELVKVISFKHPSAECRRIGGPLNGTVEPTLCRRSSASRKPAL